ncbi:MAG: Yip1 family protein [Gammaproteobacteria bacterium]|nr:Yip1 family protein [Gammaproteobacteria bacterium]
MLDFQKTIELIKNGLLEPRATWQSYAAENRGWQDTALLLTLPLIIASFVLAAVLSLIFGGYGRLGMGMGVGGWLVSLVMALVAIAVVSFIFSFLAGLFKGRHDFDKGLAALSLAAIPAYLGNIIAVVPYIGWIVSLALAIVSFVFLYKNIPLFLEVPDDKRVLHYIASLVASFIVMLILGSILGAGSMISTENPTSMPGQTGMLGGAERYARVMEEANQHQYEPPADGKITDAQMNRYLEMKRKTAEIRGEQTAHLAELQAKYEDKEPGIADIGELSGGLGSMLGTISAEMEVVVTGEGNWAEHQWITEQLRVARVQKDLDEAVAHNYALYQAHEDELKKLSAGI